MSRNPTPKRTRPKPKAVLRLPDLDQAKSAVLNSLTSVDAQRGYRHAIDEFVGHIGVSRIRIWLVPIDRRSPVDRNATQNEAKKNRHVQPLTPAHQKMVFSDDEHARLIPQRARGGRFVMTGWRRVHFRHLKCVVYWDAGMN